MNVSQLIKSIVENEKIKDQFDESRVYSDEPILFTASQMKNYTPPIYRKMREIADSYYFRRRSSAEIFYNQAKLMEHYEDSFDYRGEFFAYFPTYQSMNNLQLRGYFAWRTAVRRGDINAVSLSFACVYLYELINLIGVDSPEDGYVKMKYFCDTYTQKDRRLNHYASGWLRDFVIYYGLDKTLLATMPMFDGDREMLSLLEYRERDAHEITAALCRLSFYDITESKFYKLYPFETECVVRDVYQKLADYYESVRKENIFNALFGSRVSCERTMFTSAVFFEEIMHPDCVYEINELTKYVCKNGRWTLEQRYRYSSKNDLITMVLKTIDCVMRQKFSYKYKLKPVIIDGDFLEIINNTIEEFLEERGKTAIPKIEIDTSLLQRIRDTSLITQNKLIVDDDALSVQTETDDEPLQPPDSNFPLPRDETEFLRAVLSGENIDSLLKNRRIPVSVIVDSINEKFFDMFGDTVLLIEGGSVIPVGDYEDELKGIIGL